MKMHHRVFVTVDLADWQRLESLGFDLDQGRRASGRLRIEAEDGDPNWLGLKEIALRCGGEVFSITTFSQQELDSAQYLQFTAYEKINHAPNKPYGFRSVSYDASQGCLNCMVGLRQSSDFTPRKPVKWGRDSVVQFSGIWDEVFVKPEAWETVFKPFGIVSRPVRLYKSGEVLPDIVQLVADEHVELDLHPTEPFTHCAVCGQRRYDIHNIGFMPLPKTDPKTHLFKSTQWFGTGHNARQQLMISQELYQAIKASKLRGAWFRPCGPQIPQWKQPMTAENAQ